MLNHTGVRALLCEVTALHRRFVEIRLLNDAHIHYIPRISFSTMFSRPCRVQNKLYHRGSHLSGCAILTNRRVGLFQHLDI